MVFQVCFISGEVLYVHSAKPNVAEAFSIIFRCYGDEVRRVNACPMELAKKEFGYEYTPSPTAQVPLPLGK